MLSAKTEYACLALVRLAAEHAGGQPLQGRRLAAEERIPEGFLTQIMQQLKRQGLVTSVRGASGGYRLARSPEETTVADVLALLEDVDQPACSNLSDPTPFASAMTELCEQANQAKLEVLRGVTLADLAARSAPVGAGMYYI